MSIGISVKGVAGVGCDVWHYGGVPDLAARIEQRLEELGLSLNKAGELAGWVPGYLSRVKHRKRRSVGPEMLERLAAALRVHFDWLQRGVGEKELGPDPAGAEGLPERAVVGMRVAIGRGLPADEALERLQAYCKEHPRRVEGLGTQEWIAVATGEQVDVPGAEDGQAETTVHYDPRYPAREQAIRLVVDAGEATEEEATEAADAVAVALASDEDLPTLAWVDEIRTELRRRRRGIGRVGARRLTEEDARREQEETERRFEDALKRGKKKGRKG